MDTLLLKDAPAFGTQKHGATSSLPRLGGVWELEAGSQPKITTVQAAGIICTVCAVDGVDRVGNNYLDQGVLLSKEMALFDSLSHITSEPHRKVYTITA